MKWFKHESSSHNDEIMREIIHEFGCEGYGVYMIILELIAEKIDQNLSPCLSITDRVLREKSRVSHQKLNKILSFFDQNSLVFSNFSGKSWDLSCPNLLNRLDNWTKNSQATNKQVYINKNENKKKEEELSNGASPNEVHNIVKTISEEKTTWREGRDGKGAR